MLVSPQPPSKPEKEFAATIHALNRNEHYNRCPFTDACANDKDLELRCILSRIALDLHTLTRKTMLSNAHL